MTARTPGIDVDHPTFGKGCLKLFTTDIATIKFSKRGKDGKYTRYFQSAVLDYLLAASPAPDYLPSFVTPDRTPTRGVGRPRKHASSAARQKAYRARQFRLQPNAYVRHSKHGEGIIVYCSSTRVLVAFNSGEERMWRDINPTELTAVGQAKKLPTWADPEIRDLKKRVVQISRAPKHELGHMPGVKREDIRTYRKRGKGKTRQFRDYRNHINDRLARLATNLK